MRSRGSKETGWEVEDGDDGVTRLGNPSCHGVVEGGQSREASGLVRELSHEEALRILLSESPRIYRRCSIRPAQETNSNSTHFHRSKWKKRKGQARSSLGVKDVDLYCTKGLGLPDSFYFGLL